MKIGIILSGGTGTRIGGNIPKQYIEVAGKPIISYCMKTIFSHTDKVIIVAAKEWQEFIEKNVGKVCENIGSENTEIKVADFAGFALPGENRQLSIYNALVFAKGFASEDDIVLVHDAARPFVTAQTIENCFSACGENDGALPVLPMKDTVYLSEDGKTIGSLLERQKLFAGQAPEAFLYGKYLEANERLLPSDILKINGSTEPAVMAGMKIAMIPGDEHNYKVTSPADLERFREEVEKQ